MERYECQFVIEHCREVASIQKAETIKTIVINYHLLSIYCVSGALHVLFNLGRSLHLGRTQPQEGNRSRKQVDSWGVLFTSSVDKFSLSTMCRALGKVLGMQKYLKQVTSLLHRILGRWTEEPSPMR